MRPDEINVFRRKKGVVYIGVAIELLFDFDVCPLVPPPNVVYLAANMTEPSRASALDARQRKRIQNRQAQRTYRM